RGADAGRRAAAERDRVPAPALQRPSHPRTLDQFDEAEPVHRRCRGGAGDAVGDPDRRGAVPRPQRGLDHRHPGRRQRTCRRRHGAGQAVRDVVAPPRLVPLQAAPAAAVRPRHLADAAARSAAAGAAQPVEPDLDDRAARLSGRRRRARAVADRAARHGGGVTVVPLGRGRRWGAVVLLRLA
ncbi:hypothetical protein chiPu_0033042, partial [Chiloscyllium punctatum]|nr:hypothetical protein [Chiloscyllium punctatum]